MHSMLSANEMLLQQHAAAKRVYHLERRVPATHADIREEDGLTELVVARVARRVFVEHPNLIYIRRVRVQKIWDRHPPPSPIKEEYSHSLLHICRSR